LMTKKLAKPRTQNPAPTTRPSKLASGDADIRTLIARHDLLEAQHKYEKVSGADAFAFQHADELAAIERKLSAAVAVNFDEVLALLEFATRKIAKRLMADNGKVGEAALLRNLAAGIKSAKTNLEVRIAYMYADKAVEERRERAAEFALLK
jgi:hypothetical protein